MVSSQLIETVTRLINDEVNEQMRQLKEENKQLKVELNTKKFELNSVVKLYSRMKNDYETLKKTIQPSRALPLPPTSTAINNINQPLQAPRVKNTVVAPNLSKSFKDIGSDDKENDDSKKVRRSQSLYDSKNTILPPPTKKLKPNDNLGSDTDFRLLPTQYSDEDDSVLKSSPVKISPTKPNNIFISPKKSPKKLLNEVNREIHLMSTQYSASSSVAKSQVEIQSSPNKIEEVVEDSQQEEEEIVLSSSDNELLQFIEELKPRTKLKRMQIVTSFYERKFVNDEVFIINLTMNPIHEQGWKLSDFKPNPIWIKKRNVSYVKTPGGKAFERRIGITKSEESNIRKFYQLVNRSDKKQVGENDANVSDNNYSISSEEDEEDYEDQISQIFDKLASPPGFMESAFPDSEERDRRREIINARQARRLVRRIKACTQVNKFKEQVGEFVFTIEILNKYVKANRFTT